MSFKTDLKSKYLPRSIENGIELIEKFHTIVETDINTIYNLKIQLKDLIRENHLGIIRKEEYRLQQRRILSCIFAWVDNNIPDHIETNEVKKSIEKQPLINLSNLKNKIFDALRSSDIEVSIKILKTLVSNLSIKEEINIIENQHNEFEWKLRNGALDIQDWKNQRGKIIIKINSIVKGIKKDDLKLEWKSSFVNTTLGLEKSDTRFRFTIFSRIDQIQIPAHLEESPDKQKFKRLMYLFQDHYQAKQFTRAWKYGQRLCHQIEPESAQLYEYLLLTWFKKEGEEKIISKALEYQSQSDKSQVNPIDFLFVYASRFKELQSRSKKCKDIPASKTGEYNLKDISAGLTNHLAQKYSQIKNNSCKENIQKIKKCIEIGNAIHFYLSPDTYFATIMINELCGGNKHKWIDIDSKGEFIDVESFRALNKINNLIDIIKSTSDRNEKSINIELSNNLLASLEKKYFNEKKTNRN